MNFTKRKYYALFCLLASTATIAESQKSNVANEKQSLIESTIISKVTETYGGKSLTFVKSISITDHNKMISSGQGESPEQPGFFRINEVLTIDFENKRKSMLSWRVSRTSTDLEKFIFDGNQGRIYDILNNKYAQEDWVTYHSTGDSIIRQSDTMIARSLSKNNTKVSYQGEAFYLGSLHQKLNVKIGVGAEYTIFIDKQLGLISKMVRQHPSAGEISYAFSNHKKSGGLIFAQDLNFTVGGQTRLVSLERNVTVNPNLEEAFAVPMGYTNWGPVLNSSELVVNKLAENVYHIGKERSFTLFVDAGDYFIASGGHSGLTEKFEALKKITGVEKPLNYMISTHHHDEHFPSLKEAVALGAKVITVKQHLAPINKSINEEAGKNNIVLIKDKSSLGNGAVEIYNIATLHADNYLLVYVPAAKLVFAEDHFETQLKTAMPRVHKDMVVFRKAMEALPINVERLIDGHSSRQLSINEFNNATDTYTDFTCPAGFSICNNG